MALKFSMVLQAVDRVTAPARRVRTAVGGMTAGIRQFAQQMRRTSQDVQSGARSLEYYQTRARRMRQVALERTFRAAAASARQLATNVRGAVRNLDLLTLAGRAAGRGTAWVGEKVAGLAKWGAAGVAAGAGLSLFNLFDTAGQMEQFRIAFQVAEGSADKAKAKLDWISKFAADTPYELDQTIEAFRTLQSVAGVDPTDGSLRIVGDAAAGTSKDLQQVAEAYADAVNMSFERLLELGLRATQQGNKVTFVYRKNGQAITKTVKKDGLEVKKALEAIWKDQFGGSTLAQSKSLFGILSNIKDMWSRFQVMVADAGIFDKVKGKLSELYDWVSKLAENGKLKVWAKDISDALGAAFDWAVNLIQNTDWKAFGRDLQKVGKAAWDIANGVADAVRSYQRWRAQHQARTDEINEQGGLVSEADKKKAREDRQALEREYGPLTDTGRVEAARNRAPAVSKPQASAGAVRVGGLTKVEVKFVGPLRGKVISTDAENDDVPTVVNLGHSMGGPA
jgi:phage tail tape-measure protein